MGKIVPISQKLNFTPKKGDKGLTQDHAAVSESLQARI